MTVTERIRHKLHGDLAPLRLTVIDDSARHAGHAAARPEGETHFRVEIVSAAFRGRSRIERHRMVNSVLREELADRVHALSIIAMTPEEEADRPASLER